MADLVKRLRGRTDPLDAEAADAIEELTRALQTVRNYCDAPHWSATRKHAVCKLANDTLSKYGAPNG